jgi:hypothetical protein
VAGVLALHWAWSGAVYHLVYFRPVNGAATAFGALSLVEAALLAWWGVLRRDLVFRPSESMRGRVGLLFIAYSFAYPLLGLLFGLEYPRVPLYGVPCPTGLLTVGALLLAPGREIRPLAVVPVLWAAVGGSAAFLLGIRADMMLMVAGLVLVVHILVPARRTPEQLAG